MNKISLLKRIFEKRRYRVDVIFSHLADVLEQEGKRFQNTILNVQFWYSVLIHKTRENLNRGIKSLRRGADIP